MRQEIIKRCLYLVIMPIARFCIRHSIKLPEAYEILKSALVNAAKEDLSSRSETINASRINIMTGVHRADIARIKLEGIKTNSTDYITRVITQWQHNKQFNTSAGKPRTLEVTGKQSEFVELVSSVSKDLNPYTILFELERVGAIKRTTHGIKLVTREYVPREDLVAGFELLESDSNNLILTLEENITKNPKPLNHHLCTSFDKIPSEHLLEVRQWLIREGAKFHDKVRAYLVKHDADMTPTLNKHKSFGKIMFASFSRVVDDKKQ